MQAPGRTFRTYGMYVDNTTGLVRNGQDKIGADLHSLRGSSVGGPLELGGTAQSGAWTTEEIDMKGAYRVFGYLIAAEVVIQAAAIALAVFGLSKWIEDG